LDTLLAQKRRFSSDLIAYTTDRARGDMPVLDKKIMDSIRQSIAYMQGKEKEAAKTHRDEMIGRIWDSDVAFVTLLGATVLILTGVFTALCFHLAGRAHAEERLEKVSAEMQDLYDYAPCGHHSLDASGTFIQANKTLLQWLGYTSNELLGRMHFKDIIPVEMHSYFEENFAQFLRAGSIADKEFTLIRKNGDRFQIVLSASSVYDAQGNFVRSRTTLFDNTGRKTAEEKAHELNQELEAFTYSVSHDLRAPLRSIHGYSQMLQNDYAEKLDVHAARMLATVMKNALKMGDLIDDLLDFARVGRKALQHATINMDDLVNSVVLDIVDGRKYASTTITVNGLSTAFADAGLIRQVWFNLISNAFKYSSKEELPQVWISAFDTGTEIVYSIRDNGVGFDMQYMHKLFLVFQRLHKDSEFEGTGVGLALVHRIITRHGGRVWAESVLRQGTTFYFSLPLEEMNTNHQ
jgi:PAS domain S-box-containing protein